MPSKQTYPQYNSKHVFELLRKLEKEIRSNLVEAKQRMNACKRQNEEEYKQDDCFVIGAIDARVIDRSVNTALELIEYHLHPFTPKPITLEQAKILKPGQIVYSTHYRDSTNSPCRIKINGTVKTWKRNAERIQVPYKYGLGKGSGHCGYITQDNLHDFTLESNF